jgi:hypothetical protein
MTDQHPITPPPELVHQWINEEDGLTAGHIATQAARWGGDQELEACCVEVEWLESSETAKRMRERRRPEPPSLKEQALDALREAESTGCLYVNGRSDLIRKALEALPDKLEGQ